MLTRLDPFFADPFRLHRELFGPRLFASQLGAKQEQAGPQESAFLPPVDLYEDDSHVELTAELPGMAAENVSVEIEEGVLTLKGTRTFEKKEEGEGTFRTERSYGSFERRFSLPDAVDPEAVEATMENGLLRLHLPKRPEVKPRRIAIGEGGGKPKLEAAA